MERYACSIFVNLKLDSVNELRLSMFLNPKLDSVNELRLSMFLKKYQIKSKEKTLTCIKKIEESSVPPCSRVLRQKIL